MNNSSECIIIKSKIPSTDYRYALAQISNITSTRLESEYDIDPIFAKMSTNMDQGGARGMLLGKLNVENGLNIVFDATAIINTDFSGMVRYVN